MLFRISLRSINRLIFTVTVLFFVRLILTFYVILRSVVSGLCYRGPLGHERFGEVPQMASKTQHTVLKHRIVLFFGFVLDSVEMYRFSKK
jgi:hypothetical protein